MRKEKKKTWTGAKRETGGQETNKRGGKTEYGKVNKSLRC